MNARQTLASHQAMQAEYLGEPAFDGEDLEPTRAEQLVDMQHALRRLFVFSMEHANAPSTPKVPTTVRYNAAGEFEMIDRWAYRIRQMPVTVVASEMLDTRGGTDDHLRLMIAPVGDLVAMRSAQLAALASEYADAYSASLLDAGWLA